MDDNENPFDPFEGIRPLLDKAAEALSNDMSSDERIYQLTKAVTSLEVTQRQMLLAQQKTADATDEILAKIDKLDDRYVRRHEITRIWVALAILAIVLATLLLYTFFTAVVS